jgi:transcriptional regulator GlxA family with amidase domain
MSPRNFARRYMEARKRTPARAVESIRVDAARRALEETNHRLDEIARHCGFSNEEHLRPVFARRLGISSRAYRKRFANA